MIICHPLVFGSEADNVTVSVTIPTGFSFNGQPSGGGGFTCNPSTVGIATCTGGTVFSDDTVTITIPVIASSTVGSFTATATVDPSNLIAERDETNNSGSVTLSTVPLPNLLATESATPSPFPTFTPVTYRINVFNLGSGAANNVSISMFTVLPASLVTWTIGGGFTCNAPAGGPQALQINCSGGSLPAFSSATLTIQVKIFNQSTPSGTPFTLFGSLDPQNLIPETNESDNSFTAAAIVQ
jgi:hypothetical protein